MKVFALVACVLAAPAWALSPSDVGKLAGAKISDEVILAQIRAEKAVFELTPDQILDLKKAGVSDAVLKAMIETRSPDASPKKTEPCETGRLLLANDAKEPYSVMVSPEARSVFFYFGRLQDRTVLEPGASRTLEVPPGAYAVRWVGEKAKLNAPVAAGGTTRVVATRIETEDYAGLHVSVLEGEQEADAGVIKVFHETPRVEPAASPSPVYAYSVPAPLYLPPPPSPLRPEPRHRSTPFLGPWTLLGAGVGAVVGHQSDSRDKGAALGAVLGHFLDHLDPD